MKLHQVMTILSLALLTSCLSKAPEEKSTAEAATPSPSPSSEETPPTSDTTTTVNQNEVVMIDGSNVQGIYAGDLLPVNHNLHFRKVGAVMLKREGDNFSAHVRLKNGPKHVPHKQAVYSGRRCPTLSDDTNGDAFVDMKEAMVAIGKMTIPLDGDLDAQEAGYNQFPDGGETGKYFYQQMASFERFFADLKSPDLDPEDNMIKIDPEDGITFPGRVVIVQGIPSSTLLPPTISIEEEGMEPYESLPVACAVLWKVNEVPPDLMLETSSPIN